MIRYKVYAHRISVLIIDKLGYFQIMKNPTNSKRLILSINRKSISEQFRTTQQ